MTNNQFNVPILFLIFNRPDTTQLVFDQIKQIKPEKLYVAADGPRTDKDGEFEKCAETRDIIKQINWDCEVKTLFRNDNLGCGKAVSTAISWFFGQVEYGIILEDDCLPTLSFFPYCEELLLKYIDDEDIMIVDGHNYQNGEKTGKGSYYFSQYPHIWGWASWRRAWKYYDFEMKGLDEFLEKKINTIFINTAERNYWKKILLYVNAGKINTWDYQWFYSIWKNNGLAITPYCNFVINLGLNNTSTHTFLRDSSKEINEHSDINFPLIHPEKIINTKADRNTYQNVFSHSLKKIFLLLKENNVVDLFIYTKNRFLHR